MPFQNLLRWAEHGASEIGHECRSVLTDFEKLMNVKQDIDNLWSDSEQCYETANVLEMIGFRGQIDDLRD